MVAGMKAKMTPTHAEVAPGVRKPERTNTKQILLVYTDGQGEVLDRLSQEIHWTGGRGRVVRALIDELAADPALQTRVAKIPNARPHDAQRLNVYVSEEQGQLLQQVVLRAARGANQGHIVRCLIEHAGSNDRFRSKAVKRAAAEAEMAYKKGSE
jgi:hypothetical protein